MRGLRSPLDDETSVAIMANRIRSRSPDIVAIVRESVQGILSLEGRPMRRPAITLMVIGVLVAPLIGQAQSPSVSDARLHVSVEIDSRGVFVYRYAVENGARSTAGVWKLTVDISLPEGASKPSAIGLTPGPGYLAELSGVNSNAVARGGVPVGLSAPQPGWRTTVSTDASARWVAIQDASLVLPTQRLAGFSIASHGPPALRRFTLAPHIDPAQAPIMSPGDDPGDVDRYNQDFDRYVESLSVEGITLAPTAPRTVTADALLANLASQVVQARSLGWISNDGITRSVSAKLEAARAAASRRQFEMAGKILRALRNEVAAQSGKGLTSGAVALMDLNIQYILQLAAKP
jgi:hypothetical protein